MMERQIDERVEAYLDGMLGAQETREFERDLAAQPELSQALATALLLRDLLGTMPPDQAPDGLQEKIERLLEIEDGSSSTAKEPAWPRLRAAFGAATLGLRGPVLALGGSRSAGTNAIAGMAQVRWALGPLAAASYGESGPHVNNRPSTTHKSSSTHKPLWRRAFGLVWK